MVTDICHNVDDTPSYYVSNTSNSVHYCTVMHSILFHFILILRIPFNLSRLLLEI